MIRGYGTSLFNMVPKDVRRGSEPERCYGTSLFNMVPKVQRVVKRLRKSYGTSLFNMVPKEGIAINNIFCYNIYRVLEEL